MQKSVLIFAKNVLTPQTVSERAYLAETRIPIQGNESNFIVVKYIRNIILPNSIP